MIDHPLARWLRHDDDCLAGHKQPKLDGQGFVVAWEERPDLCYCGLTAALLKEKERWASQSI